VFGRQVSQLADLKPVVGTRVGGMDPELGVVSTGSGRPGFSNRRERDPEVRAEAKRTAIRRADYQLEQAQNSIDLANEPIRAYRDQLIEMMPTKGGLQLGAMLRDVRDRLEAGDPTYRDRLRRLVDASRVLATDDSIAPDRRRTLIEQARRLKKLQTEVIRSLTYDREAKLIARQEVLEAPEEEIDRLLEHLKGEPFER
jgi:DNA polymerase III delta prime subunit